MAREQVPLSARCAGVLLVLAQLMTAAVEAQPAPVDDAPEGAESAEPAAPGDPPGGTPQAEDETPGEPEEPEAPRDPGAPEEDARDADIFGPPGGPAEAEDSRDADIFGGSGDGEDARDAAMFGEPGPGAPPEADSGPASRDEAMLGRPGDAPEFASDVAPEDPLTIGGLMYLRSQSFISQGQPARDWNVSVPTLAQLYFDVRPNERVRGFAQVRLQFDPTLPASSQIGFSGASEATGGATDGVESLSSVFESGSRDVRFVFDQLWINFDVAHRVFVTAGKQHDRWGTARFWMPTDYLHLQNRNPINVFDSRAGTNMVKVHIPVESLAWNFYGYALFERPTEATNSWGEVSGAFRAEFVLGTAELSAGVFGRSGELPRIAADLSFGIWDLDFYGELAVRDASVIDRVRYDPDAPDSPIQPPPSWQTPDQTALSVLGQWTDDHYPVYQQDGMKTQVVGGVSYSARYDDDDVLTLGFEYFFNDLGYYSDEHYLGLVLPRSNPLNNPATFFYLGKHYLAGFLTLPSPFHLDLHTFTLSTLGNVSDRSYLSRIDYNYTLLTHLTLEAFFAVHYGRRTGEFRFGTDAFMVGPETVPAQPPSLVDVGVALRLQF